MHLYKAVRNKSTSFGLVLSFGLFLLVSSKVQAQGVVEVKGEFKKWHRVSVYVECPQEVCGEVSETSDPNPFTYYRLLVNFTSPGGGEVLTVPGYYAGDGQAEYSETSSGNVWMVHFAPHLPGTWTYEVSFEVGEDIVLHKDPGTSISPDGFVGTFDIQETDKMGKDFRGKGFLRNINKSYYYFSGTEEPFLKNGAGSPENLLYYHEISNTYQQDTIPEIPAHQFGPHIADYNEGDPLWGAEKSKGRGIIGALNYLGSLDVNSYYFIVQNTALDGTGQGTGVWPWITPEVDSRDRFSVSKLAQWEVVFSHMDSLGISMNMVTQDRINQWDLDDRDLGRTRKLFYRELVARFAHHLGVMWHLGEENSSSNEQIRDYSDFIREWDAYNHPIVGQANGTLDAHERYYRPLLGYENFDGASMQVGLTKIGSEDTPSPPGRIHNAILTWVSASKESGKSWVVALDEIGHWSDGIVPDGDSRDPTNRRARREGFWGTLMAGGAGADWYFGSTPFEYNDIWMEDFTVREEFFRRTRDAVDMILESGVPFWEMENVNEVSSRENTWVFGKRGEAYFVYSPYMESFQLNLLKGTYTISWYDAFEGGPLQEGPVTEVTVNGDSAWVSPGIPEGFAEDGVALIRLKPSGASRVEESARRETLTTLKQNYPNPASALTAIEFHIEEPSHVELSLWDVLGRRVNLIEDRYMIKGTHTYEIDCSALPGGFYVYRLNLGSGEAISKSLVCR